MSAMEMKHNIPCLTSANNPLRHAVGISGSLFAHKPIAATVSAANLLSGSLI